MQRNAANAKQGRSFYVKVVSAFGEIDCNPSSNPIETSDTATTPTSHAQ